MGNSRLARCPVDGIPLVLFVSTPKNFMEAVRASQDERWGSVTTRCPLCDRAGDAHDTAPEPVRPRRPRRRPRAEHVGSALKLADVANAFANAERELGTAWRLKGRAHAPRVTLHPPVSRAAHGATHSSSALVRTRNSMWPRRVFARAGVEQAAERLGVPLSALVCRDVP